MHLLSLNFPNLEPGLRRLCSLATPCELQSTNFVSLKLNTPYLVKKHALRGGQAHVKLQSPVSICRKCTFLQAVFALSLLLAQVSAA